MDILKVLTKITKFCITPRGLLLFVGMILLIGKFFFHKDYLNCTNIIKMHMNCFKNQEEKLSKVSLFLYFGVPMLIALSLIQIRILDDTVVNLLTVIVSILTSLFFTLLTLILDMGKKVRKDKKYNANDADTSSKLLKETYFTIMFEILVSVMILILCFVELFAKMYSIFSSLIIYYLTFVLLVNLFIILKRVYTVIKVDIETY